MAQGGAAADFTHYITLLDYMKLSKKAQAIVFFFVRLFLD